MYISPDTILAPKLGEQFEFGLQESLLERGSGPLNEDALAIGRDVCIVCDGATSLASSPAPESLSGGRYAANLTIDAFIDSTGLTLEERACLANKKIAEGMSACGIDQADRARLWSTSFAAVQVSGHTLHWCQSGDCTILLLYRDGSSRRVTPLPGQDSEVLARWQQLGGAKETTIHQLLGEQIAAVRRKMNRTFGSLNGEPEAMEFLACGTEDIEPVAEIILFTDGLFPPSPDPHSPFDENKFISLYRSGGLRGVREVIRNIQRGDPGCFRYPRFKLHDDIAAVSLRQL
jgi:serine/threonine protein phosphatase PrpC